MYRMSFVCFDDYVISYNGYLPFFVAMHNMEWKAILINSLCVNINGLKNVTFVKLSNNQYTYRLASSKYVLAEVESGFMVT